MRLWSDACQDTLSIPIDVPHQVDLVAFLIIVCLVYTYSVAPDVVSGAIPGRLLECIFAVSPNLHLLVVNQDGHRVLLAAPDVGNRMVQGGASSVSLLKNDRDFFRGVKRWVVSLQWTSMPSMAWVSSMGTSSSLMWLRGSCKGSWQKGGIPPDVLILSKPELDNSGLTYCTIADLLVVWWQKARNNVAR